MVGAKYLIAGLELERAHDRINSGGCVGHKDQVLGPGAYELRDLAARQLQALFVAAPQELDRLGLHLKAKARLELEYRFGAGAERAVIKEGDIRRQCPVATQPGPKREGEFDMLHWARLAKQAAIRSLKSRGRTRFPASRRPLETQPGSPKNSAFGPFILSTLHQTLLRAAPEPPRSLAGALFSDN